MVQVKFFRYGSNAAIGGFAPGDLLRCSGAMAEHLVEHAKVARYVEAPQAVQQRKGKRRR